jgi:hypothetical protein
MVNKIMKLLSCFVVAMLIIGPLLQPLTAQAQSDATGGATLGSGLSNIQTVVPSTPSASINTQFAPASVSGAGTAVGTPAAPASSDVQANINSQNAITAGTNAPNDSIGCSLTTQGIAICISNLVYFVMVGLFSNIAYICAYFFDIAVQISLNSMAYSLNFISTGWATVRDLANMAFLFLLIYIAFIVMFKAETSNTLRMLAAVVVVALLVNFSFFFTRVAIDAGNILAVQFYNAIQAPLISATASNSTGSSAASVITSYGSNGGAKDLTASIMNALNVQSLTSNTSFQQFATQQPNAFGNAMYTLIALSLVYIATGIMFALLAGSFLFAGAKFMMRTVALMFLIVASPAAFVAAAVAKTKEGGTNWFSKWFTALIKFSAYPAIYLFMFFVLSEFMQGIAGGALFSGLFNGAATQGSAAMATSIASVAVRMGFIMAMMYLALSVSEMLVTEGSQAAGAFQKKVMGGLTGGIAGFAGRNLVGRYGAKMSRDAAAEGKTSRVGDFLANRSYDFRNTPILNRGFQLANDKLPAIKGGLPLSAGDVKTREGVLSKTFGSAKDMTVENKERAKANEKLRNAAQKKTGAGAQQQTQTPKPTPVPVPIPTQTPASAAPARVTTADLGGKIEAVAQEVRANTFITRKGLKDVVAELKNKSSEQVQPNTNAHITGGASSTAPIINLIENLPTTIEEKSVPINEEQFQSKMKNIVERALQNNKPAQPEIIQLQNSRPTPDTNIPRQEAA